MRSPVLLLLLLFLLPLSGAQEEGTMLHMLEYSYQPDPLEVPAGSTIFAMNFGPQDQSLPRDAWGEYVHTVTAVDGSFDVQQIAPDGQPYAFTAPATPGEYPYYCRYHGSPEGGMRGTLVVTEAAPVATTVASATPTAASPDGETNETPAAGALALLSVGAAAAALRRRR